MRNAIAGILERYTLADVVQVALRKIRRDGLPGPFGVSHFTPLNSKPPEPRQRPLDPAEGFLATLLNGAQA